MLITNKIALLEVIFNSFLSGVFRPLQATTWAETQIIRRYWRAGDALVCMLTAVLIVQAGETVGGAESVFHFPAGFRRGRTC
jgi:hypothetical protein